MRLEKLEFDVEIDQKKLNKDIAVVEKKLKKIELIVQSIKPIQIEIEVSQKTKSKKWWRFF